MLQCLQPSALHLLLLSPCAHSFAVLSRMALHAINGQQSPNFYFQTRAPPPQTHMSNCLTDLSAWIYNTNLKSTMSKTEILTSHQPIPLQSPHLSWYQCHLSSNSTLKPYSLKLFLSYFPHLIHREILLAIPQNMSQT